LKIKSDHHAFWRLIVYRVNPPEEVLEGEDSTEFHSSDIFSSKSAALKYWNYIHSHIDQTGSYIADLTLWTPSENQQLVHTPHQA